MIKYTITELSNILGENRVNVMRLIDRLELKEINPDRPYKNSPKYYNESAFNILKKEYNINDVKQEYDNNENDLGREFHEKNTNSKDEIIKVLKEQNKILKEQLESSNKSREKLENLIDQQQRLALIYNDRDKTLKEFSNEEIVDHQYKSELKEKKKRSIIDRLFFFNK